MNFFGKKKHFKQVLKILCGMLVKDQRASFSLPLEGVA